MKTEEFTFKDAIVSVKRICIHLYAEDEYMVTVSENGKEVIAVETFGGIFESNKSIAERIYNTVVRG